MDILDLLERMRWRNLKESDCAKRIPDTLSVFLLSLEHPSVFPKGCQNRAKAVGEEHGTR